MPFYGLEYNITDTTEYKVLNYSFTFIVLVLNAFVVVSSGLIVNTGTRLKRKVTFLFLGNLALTEILNIFITLLKNVLAIDPKIQLQQCLVMEAIRVTPYIAHLYSILLIAFDRFIFIFNGLKYEQLLYSRRARILIVITWLWGLSIGVVIPLGWRRNSVRECQLIAHIVPKEYILFLFVITAIPAIFILIVYIIILFRAISKINEVGIDITNNELRSHRGNTSLRNSTISIENSGTELASSKSIIFNKESKVCIKKKLKAVYIVLLITVCFITSWLPFLTWITIYSYTCINDMDIVDDSDTCRSIGYFFIVPIPAIHGIINPLIYAWWHNGFRNISKQKFISIKNKIISLK